MLLPLAEETAEPLRMTEKEKRIKRNAYQRKYLFKRRKEIKAEIFFRLGGKCAHCKLDDPRILQIDHIKGDGYTARKEHPDNSWRNRRLLDLMLEELIENYQLLCPNCNWIKRYENKEFREHRE